MIFSHINRFDFLTNFNQIRKIRICIFCIDVCSQKFVRIRCIIFYIDFSIVFNFAHFVDIFYKLFTIKLHKYRFIDVAKSIWKFWNTMMLSNHDVICIFVNIALFKQLIFVSWCIVNSILNINIHIDVLFRENANSKRRNFSNVRSHVLEIDFTLHRKSINYRISIRSILQFSHRYTIQFFKIYVIRKVCSKVSNNTSLKKSHRWKNHIVEKISKHASLKKFVQKFYIEFVTILNRKHKRLL